MASQTTRGKKLVDYLRRRVRSEGWETVFDFASNSGQPYSAETVRKVFGGIKSQEPATIATILRYLNVEAPEIRRVLKEMTDDQELWKLLPENAQERQPTPAESNWEALRVKLLDKPVAMNAVLGVCSLAAAQVGVNVEDEITALRRAVTPQDQV